MDHRPGTTAQYAMAITDFEQPENPFNFRFGLIGSSDNHRSQAGTGYKEVKRKKMTEAFGANSPRMAERFGGDDPAGCRVEFTDEEFTASGREALYYVRAIQEPTSMINAANLRCEYDENGVCIAVNPCYGDYRTPQDEDCLAPAQQRAWSSPIFVAYRAP
jgi:hypothetical protein